ncbi:MAG TPA: hypothetical protein VGJ03_00520 [Acidimicrobiales bacterium]|jgi:hypothetical protein
MSNGMPYHLEKGPVFSTFEAHKYQTKDVYCDILGQLRQKDATGNYAVDICDLLPYKDPALNYGPYNTQELRRYHMNVHWFGMLPTGQVANGRATYTPQTNGTFQWIDNPTTGWWRNYFGDVEGIMRETLTRAAEIALGLDHGEAIPPKSQRARLRCWPMEYVVTCPAAWFEGWLSWRKTGNGQRDGHVTINMVVPAHVQPNEPGPQDLDFQNPRDGGVLDSPLRPPQRGGNDYVAQPQAPTGPYGMWVITHWDHNMELAILNVYDADGNTVGSAATSNTPTPQGQWPLPSFGLVYHGMPDPTGSGNGIVCVQPAEADGGVLPLGRAN